MHSRLELAGVVCGPRRVEFFSKKTYFIKKISGGGNF